MLLRVLLADGTTEAESAVAAALSGERSRVHITRVTTPSAMREALNTGSWDIVLSEWSMPGFGALAALDILREAQRDIPLIVVSSSADEECAPDAMRAGARDYLVRDRLARLAPAIEREQRERDIRAARHVAEDALRSSEMRFTRLVDSGIIGICVSDLRGTVHEANDAYLKMLGYTREEFDAGLVSWARMTPPEWQHTDEAAVRQLQQTGYASPWEKELFRKDGSRVPILIGVAMLDGSLCIAYQVDLNGQRSAEAALRRAEDRLRHAQKLEAIGSLAGGIAHDFNNMLSVILGYASIIERQLTSGDPMASLITEIRLAGERAATLTRHLLAFSRQQLLHPRRINLNEVVARTQSMLRRVIGEDIELAVSVAPDLPSVWVDPGQIEQVILNVALNGRDAMPTGGRLMIETSVVLLDEAFAAAHAGVAPGPHVMIAMSDTGVGIAPATQERIFEPFFTTKSVPGAGLGLSTVFGIIHQSEGTIEVQSEPGSGTTFRVYLPVVKESVDADEHRLPSTPKSATRLAHSLNGSETILLVEDEDAVRQLAATILRQRGYHVLEASGGGDALLTCERHPASIHLLLSDVVMPRMSGPQVAERLKPIRPRMKTLFMSGYAANAMQHHGVLDSSVAFITKPFTPEGLARAVREVLDEPTPR